MKTFGKEKNFKQKSDSIDKSIRVTLSIFLITVMELVLVEAI